MNLLLIEDEPNVSSFIKKGLEENGYRVMQAFDGETAISLARRGGFDFVILDVILPHANGFEICSILRRDLKVHAPILMLTALNSTEDIVKGLDLGADDYLSKPFRFNELLARIRALTRRYKQDIPQPDQLEYKDLRIDLKSQDVSRQGSAIELTATEYKLLRYFMENSETVLSKTNILENVWGLDFDISTNIVEVYVNYLRRKIDRGFEEKRIHTMIGRGYMLR